MSDTSEPPAGHEHDESAARRYPCPVCGYLSFVEPPGSFDICGVCFWEDDVVQLKNPYLHTGANRMSLIEAQKNFLEFGAMSRDALEYVQASPDGRARSRVAAFRSGGR